MTSFTSYVELTLKEDSSSSGLREAMAMNRMSSKRWALVRSTRGSVNLEKKGKGLFLVFFFKNSKLELLRKIRCVCPDDSLPYFTRFARLFFRLFPYVYSIPCRTTGRFITNKPKDPHELLKNFLGVSF